MYTIARETKGGVTSTHWSQNTTLYFDALCPELSDDVQVFE
jgi:hypothetical protein